MKNKFILFLILSLFVYKFSFSQETPDDIVKRVTRAVYIFEGRVIRSDSYWSQTQHQIYTSSTVEISKIAKGNLTCGTVEIITVGGRVGDSEIRISHNLSLTRGMMGVFLCDKNIWETPLHDYYPETNPIPLWVPDGLEGFIRFYNDGINDAVKDWQFSLDSLAQLYNLMDLYTTLNLVDCGGPLPMHNLPPNIPALSAPVYPNNFIPVAHQASSFSTSTSTIIHFDYLNRHITNTTPKYFEFDVAISDDVDTGYFYSGEFAIDYPFTVFGSNIVADTGVIVTTTGVFAGSSAYILNPFDDPISSNRLIIQIAPNSNTSDPLINLPYYGPTLFPSIHIKMKISDCFPFSTIAMSPYLPFVHPSWSNNSSYSTATPTNYSLPYWSTVLYFPSCEIHVDKISSSDNEITGGTGDTNHCRI